MTTTPTTATETPAVGTEDAEAAAIWAQFDEQDRAAAASSDTLAGTPVDDPQPEPEPAPADSIAGGGADPLPELRDGGGQPAGDGISSSQPDRAKAAPPAAQPLDHASRSDRGRIRALNREITELRKQLAALHTGAATKTEATAAGQASEALKAIKEDYPDLAPVAEVVTSLQQQVSEAQDQIRKRDSAAAQQTEQRLLDLELEALAEIHPDWQQVTDSREFVEWLQKPHPRHVREAIQRNLKDVTDHEEAADLISRFKATQTQPTATGSTPSTTAPQQPPAAALSVKRQQQLEGAAAPQTRGAPRATTGVPDDPEAAWRYFDELDRRRAAQSR